MPPSQSDFHASCFGQWCLTHPLTDYEATDALRRTAEQLLVDGVASGEITVIDGGASPMTKSIIEHHGGREIDMNDAWIGAAQDWVCPCCRRSKFGIARVGPSGRIVAKLVVHHDHMREALEPAFRVALERSKTNRPQVAGKDLIERVAGAFAAHEDVLVCQDCNNADASAKAALRLPKFFSFSPSQIAAFIEVEDHAAHRVNGERARTQWEKAAAAYALRIELVSRIATAAAADAHWYEPFPGNGCPIPTLVEPGVRNRLAEHRSIAHHVDTERLVASLRPQGHARTTPNLARWREPGKATSAAPPPANYEALLRSDRAIAKRWDHTPDSWTCPVCQRTKHAVVRRGSARDNSKITLPLAEAGSAGGWNGLICADCKATLMALKREAVQLLGHAHANSYDFVAPHELRAIIRPRSHSAHSIDPEAAEKLLAVAVRRMRAKPRTSI